MFNPKNIFLQVNPGLKAHFSEFEGRTGVDSTDVKMVQDYHTLIFVYLSKHGNFEITFREN